MRCLLLALTCLIATAASAADSFEGLDFSDGQSRSEASLAGQMVCVVYFSGECPTARQWMGGEVRMLHDWLEQKHVNATLVLVTPDVAASDLPALDSDRGYHMVHALYANDPSNHENISLGNIYQVRLLSANGNWRPVSPVPLLANVQRAIAMLGSGPASRQHYGDLGPGATPVGMDVDAPAQSEATGHYRVDLSGLTDKEVLAAWWDAERCRPGANKAILAGAKRAKDGAQIRMLADQLTAYYAAREQTVSTGSPTIQTIEALETLMMEGDGFPLKLAHKAIHDLMRAPALKSELRAREAYREDQPLVKSPRQSDQENGRQALTDLVQAAPNTVYGQKAAALLQSLPALRHGEN